MCPRGRPRGQGRPRGLHLCCLHSLFEHSARKSEYLDRGAAVCIAKHQQKSVTNRNRTKWRYLY